MKNIEIKLMTATGIALAFQYLFWQEALGINLLIFHLILLTVIGWKSSWTFNAFTKTLIALSLVAVLQCVIWNTTNAFIGYMLITLGLVGAGANPMLKSFGLLISQAINHIPNGIAHLFSQTVQRLTLIPHIKSNLKWLRRALIPILVLCLFGALFSSGSITFGLWLSELFQAIFQHLELILSEISIGAILFLTLGLIIGATLIYQHKDILLNRFENQFGITLTRPYLRQQARTKPKLNNNTIALKEEYSTAVLTILSVNILLFLVNCADIYGVWFHGNSKHFSPSELSQFVHQGTWHLIITITLSMICLVFFFRGNLNYYPKNRFLTTLAYIWIAQNLVLLSSVIGRNLWYIGAMGLSLKRIGVFVFILLVIIGLLSVYQKIKHQKSFFYLYLINSWVWVLIWIPLGFFDWERIVTTYNLSQQDQNEIDYPYLLSLSNKNLDLLEEHLPKAYQPLFKNKKECFDIKKGKQGWKSWNYSDHLINQRIKNIHY